MAWYDYTVQTVAVQPDGDVRAIHAPVSVTDPDGNPVNLLQGGTTVSTVTAGSDGWTTFQADVPVVKLSALDWTSLWESEQQRRDTLSKAEAASSFDLSGNPSLRATFARGATSPRDASRVKLERKPVAHIAQEFPSAWHDHQIVWVNNARRIWAIGRDRRLRSSGNGGVQWEHLAHSGTGRWAKLGIFLMTQAESFITTFHPDGTGTWPSIVRSNNSGLSFTEVVPATTGVDYQGVTSICQDLTTGYIYLVEYVGTEATSFRILRSIDDGATWTTFHTFPSNGEPNFVRHGHGAQYDPISQRVFFLIGDAEQEAGIYRTTADGSTIEPVFLNKHSRSGDGLVATAVGMAFFPDYIAWGMDQTTDSWLIRLPRSEFGAASPNYEKVARLQSTAFHCIRAADDSSEWVMAVSNENIGVGSVDRTVHLYRLADNAATLDEVLSWAPSYLPDNTGRYPYPVGTPLQSDADGLIWLAMLTQGPLDPLSTTLGQQYAIRLGWGTVPAVRADTMHRKPFYAPATQSSGPVALAANETKVFGGIKVPAGETRRLYLMDMGTLTTLGGSRVEVWNATKGALVKDAASAADMSTTAQSLRENLKRETGPYVYSSALLDAGDVLHFRIAERTGASGTFTAFVNYAFGI